MLLFGALAAKSKYLDEGKRSSLAVSAKSKQIKACVWLQNEISGLEHCDFKQMTVFCLG